MAIDFGALAAHVASALGALRGYDHRETAAAKSLEYVQDELMKLYNSESDAEEFDSIREEMALSDKAVMLGNDVIILVDDAFNIVLPHLMRLTGKKNVDSKP